MDYNIFYKLYDNFKLDFYNKLYGTEDDGDDRLTVSESFCLEVISSFKDATVKEVAEFMKISQPNAAFKISNLEKKGYINKVQSTKDRRNFYLRETDKYYEYRKKKNEYIGLVIDRVRDKLNEEEQKELERYAGIIIECMPEITNITREKEEFEPILKD